MAPAEDLPPVEAVDCRGVDLPVDAPVQTALGTLGSTPLALVDVRTGDGSAGHAYLRAYTLRALPALVTLVRSAGELLVGAPADPPAAAARLAAHFALAGFDGLVAMAAAGLDMATWDARARAAGVPLVRYLGGEPRPLPAYATLRSMEPDGALRAAAKAVAAGFRAVKVKLGTRGLDDDRALLERLRAALGDGVAVMADYNQSLSREEALRRLPALDDLGLAWFEEPLAAADDEGHAALAARLATPVQLGESWWGTDAMQRSLAAGACDEAMLDVARIGGVSGWRRASELAGGAGLGLSSHTFGEYSAHLLAASPTARWIEYLDHAGPVLAEALPAVDGHVTPPERPGAGVEWDERAVARHRVC